MKYLFLSLLFLSVAIAFGQPTDTIPYNKLFVKLKTGEVLFGHSFLTHEGLHHNKFMLDGKLFKRNEVSFYNDGALYGNNDGYFIKRVCTAKNLILFEPQQKSSSNGREPVIKEYLFFYSNGLTKVKKLKAKNLLKDMQGNDEAYNLMKKAKKSIFGRKKKMRQALLVYCPELPQLYPYINWGKKRPE